ncbi:MAG TPA: hypothetical protein VFY84_20730 [Jiangellales bacterium]|nr:hypothetical protein [Jiangellales bacterium]
MNGPADPTPYRPHGKRTSRRRTVLIVLAAIVVVAIGLTLHLTGVLLPQ